MRELAASGLNAREFADRHGVERGTLVWWRWELARRDRLPVSTPRFVEIMPSTLVLQAPGGPVVEAGPRESGVEIVTGVGNRVRLAIDFDAATLRRALEVLGAGGC